MPAMLAERNPYAHADLIQLCDLCSSKVTTVIHRISISIDIVSVMDATVKNRHVKCSFMYVIVQNYNRTIIVLKQLSNKIVIN